MSSEPVIEARGLGKAYPIYRRPEDRLKQLLWGSKRRRYYEEFWAVRDVDLRVGRGETVGIIGRNGSGKSTLLQMICGTLRPSAGNVRVQGRIAAMLELGSGFNPEFTGRENVRLGAAVLGLSAEEIEARFETIVEFAEIGAFMEQPLKHYSSGMHARLAFAVCANVDADVLIVDEVLSVGDAAFQQKCMRFLNRFRMHGTLLFVSHDGGSIVRLCDRALWLEQGAVRGLGDAKEMCRLYLAAQAEEGADDRTQFNLGGRKPSPRISSSEESNPISAEVSVAEPDVLIFDADDHVPVSGGAEIESVGFFGADGAQARVAAGGEAFELRIICRAVRAIAQAAIAFVVRDRLGQILFSDDTYNGSSGAPLNVAAGKRFTARFDFFLPYLASGAYAIDAFVFARNEDGFDLLARMSGKEFLYVQSVHPSNGLANIAMRDVSIEIGGGLSLAAAESSVHEPENAAGVVV
ncbi:MAG TPA: ABC transporter ATP-binding protein [Rhizomicrobium sp.]